MFPVDRLMELLAVAQEGSIAAASARLGITRSTLSRHLSTLEDDLGTKLLHRGPRSVRLTRAGELLVERARRIASDADDAWQVVRGLDASPRGPIRVSTPPSELFQDLLIGFAVRHPDVQLVVEATSRHVDLLQEDIDVALRFGTVTDDALITRRLPSTPCSLVASGTYLAARGHPRRVAELGGHQCILGFGQTGLPGGQWPLRSGGRVTVTAHFASNGMTTSLHAALAGLGIALLPDRLTAPYRAGGDLVFVLPGVVGMDLQGQLVYLERRHLLPVVRAFIDFTVKYVAERDGLRPLPLAEPERG